MIAQRCLLLSGSVLAVAAALSCVPIRHKHMPPKPPTEGGAAIRANPVTSQQCTQVDENVSFLIERKAGSACIANLWAYIENPTCKGSGDPVEVGRKDPNRSIAPLAGNYACPETITISRASPCILYEIDSDGDPYKLCYHDNRRIKLEYCLRHTGVCGPPHNP